MIARLSGTLAEVTTSLAIVDVNGVGYAVTIPASTYDKLPRTGMPVVLFTHLQVREDSMELFGFASVEERRVFRLLQTASGVGPRLALSILSCMPIEGFCQAVAAQDVKALSRIDGVGKRTAERLIVELKDRIADMVPGAGLGSKAVVAARPAASGRAAQDAVAALETLGFKGDLAQRAVNQVCAELPATEQSAENLIRRALQLLNQG